MQSLTYLDSFSRFCNNTVRLAFISQQIVDLRVQIYHHIVMLFAYLYNEQIRINELLGDKIYRSKIFQEFYTGDETSDFQCMNIF